MEDYAFSGENPAIRATLQQLAHAYFSALATGDRKLAQQIKRQALQLKVYQDIASN